MFHRLVGLATDDIMGSIDDDDKQTFDSFGFPQSLSHNKS